MELNKIYNKECTAGLKELPEKSIHCCVTSPPYWGLRDYGTDDQLGLEETPQQYVDNMVKLFREVKRVLKDDGTLWLNLGDSYSSGGRQSTTNQSKPKDLIGIPWRVAFALQADGWYLRQDIIWHKPNPMPESVQDRCTKSHEYIFLLSKSPSYYYDNESIKEKALGNNPGNKSHKYFNSHDEKFRTKTNLKNITAVDFRNKRSVWTVNTKSYKEAHFATYPEKLIVPCIKAGCPEKVCSQCGEAYIRNVESKRIQRHELPKNDPRYRPKRYKGAYLDINGKGDAGYSMTKDMGLEKQCNCKINNTKGGIVLDPFMGSGTTGLVARKLNRNYIGFELNADYIKIAEKRIFNDIGLFGNH